MAGRKNLGEHTMAQFIKPLKNEQGYFLIISTLMLLALLTIISIAASKTARTEVQIAGNDATYQRNFYLAEGAAMEAVDRLKGRLWKQSIDCKTTPILAGSGLLCPASKRSMIQLIWITGIKIQAAKKELRRMMLKEIPGLWWATRERQRAILWASASPGFMSLWFTGAPKSRVSQPSKSDIVRHFRLYHTAGEVSC